MTATTDRTPANRMVPVFEAIPPETLVDTANPDLIRAAIELLETETQVKRVVAAENQSRARPGVLRLCQERAKQIRQPL
jgi:type II secretory pathway component PulK